MKKRMTAQEVILFLSCDHKHTRVFPFGMTQHLVGEMRAAARLVQQFLRLVELAQLAVDLWQLQVNLFIGVLLKQGQQALQVVGEVFVVLDE